MIHSERLDAMRADIAGCSLVSFGDLQTALALRTSSAAPCPREKLDEIFAQAVASFAAADKLAQDMAQGGEPAEDTLVMTPRDLRVFVRSQSNGADVVCAVGDSHEAVPAMIASARELLRVAARGG
ncbi:hypothetical protein BXY70_1085 [Roseovarius halotolerans]|uniref:Roadblock/LC7 domain protein n=1 Tax=Roseovarius halotolerans TaxID=505353 RepID=A0A1X6Y976_9RHOB|nr:hypothetical protein [Roseovarius halotolerans]RKT35057.1 hypothetical protein BXY70_1085 [Roseovarius halotolerans]SLN14392.1 hypothetical protein ROH8110_00311 [Roseovarius halotolerans]